MDLERVEILVDSLACACEAALNLYARWSAKQATENRYHNSRSGRRFSSDSVQSAPTSSQAHAPIKCAASTSLEMSSYRIRSTYQIGVTLIGPDFADGDGRPHFPFAGSYMYDKGDIDSDDVSAMPGITFIQPLSHNGAFTSPQRSCFCCECGAKTTYPAAAERALSLFRVHPSAVGFSAGITVSPLRFWESNPAGDSYPEGDAF
ncbi:hypothetical protein QBC43DRAFT_328460 [Cladorrhinum sp. PSN259]|nr:hypothetical protein QBC43DRAFT_328460 [Cladorrhinum sp. PSN259]